ncbi:MAG: DUF3034 family protein [Candidatus Omnitrophota bacterium]
MKKSILILALIALSLAFAIKDVLAGPPLTNLEGVGGIAFNPLAYPADSDGDNSHVTAGGVDVVGKPRFGAWYVNLDHVKVDWTAIGVADTFFKRLETSYGFETINQDNATAKHKNNLGAKFLVLPENSFDTKFLPAVSVGTIYKHTSNIGAGTHSSGEDYYAVATKLITQLPQPVLLSGGILSTNSRTTGVFGYDNKRKLTGFGNIDVVLPKGFITGFEYKQGAHYPTWKDADYWDAHLAWTPTKSLTLVGAYVNAGDQKSASKVGLGDGVVFSAQYAF